MLTPDFTLSQDDDYVIVHARTPYVRAKELEVSIEVNEARIHVKPYFLKLNFDYAIVEDGREKASFDPNTHELTVWLPKAERGQDFGDLSLLTWVMTDKKKSKGLGPDQIRVAGGPLDEPTLPSPKRANVGRPAVEVIEELAEGTMKPEDLEDEEIDWSWTVDPKANPQGMQALLSDQSLLGEDPIMQQRHRYGFDLRRTGVYSGLDEALRRELGWTISDDPATYTYSERMQMMQKSEGEDFDDEHYAADYAERIVQMANLTQMPWWEEIYRSIKADIEAQEAEIEQQMQAVVLDDTSKDNNAVLNHSTKVRKSDDMIRLTGDESSLLSSLPKRDYSLLEHKKNMYLALVDLLLVYSYEYRQNGNDPTVESAWTVQVLSPTLRWHVVYESVGDVTLGVTRRIVTYPLQRHWTLAALAIKDAAIILSLGRRAVVKALLHLHKVLRAHEVFYVVDQLYIQEFTSWVQSPHCKTAHLRRLSEELLKSISEARAECLEKFALLAIEEAVDGGQEETDSDETDTDDTSNEDDSDSVDDEGIAAD
eukprot:Clim_evm11s40 gene=Clim_evmTU11s40